MMMSLSSARWCISVMKHFSKLGHFWPVQRSLRASTLPEASTAWGKVDARSDLCTGQKCPSFEKCFITLMHQRALDSDIIIVNHHLFFADLSLRDENYEGGILPEYHAVVFDEAHEIEDVAAQYFGVSVSNYRFQELRRDLASVARVKKFGTPE